MPSIQVTFTYEPNLSFYPGIDPNGPDAQKLAMESDLDSFNDGMMSLEEWIGEGDVDVKVID